VTFSFSSFAMLSCDTRNLVGHENTPRLMVHSHEGFLHYHNFYIACMSLLSLATYRIYWLYGYVSQVYITETKWRLETSPREYQDT